VFTFILLVNDPEIIELVNGLRINLSVPLFIVLDISLFFLEFKTTDGGKF